MWIFARNALKHCALRHSLLLTSLEVFIFFSRVVQTGGNFSSSQDLIELKTCEPWNNIPEHIIAFTVTVFICSNLTVKDTTVISLTLFRWVTCQLCTNTTLYVFVFYHELFGLPEYRKVDILTRALMVTCKTKLGENKVTGNSSKIQHTQCELFLICWWNYMYIERTNHKWK